MFVYDAPADEGPGGSDVITVIDGEQEPLTNDHLSRFPAISPDGSQIVFSSGRGGWFSDTVGYEQLALFLTSTNGGNQTRLTRGPFDTEPEWSPGGSQIVFVRGRPPGERGGGEELWTVEVATKQKELLYRVPRSTAGRRNKVWSPAWSPDGRHIAFGLGNGRRHRAPQDLWLIRSDGSDHRRILEDVGFSYNSPELDWSPAGDALAFEGSQGHSDGVHVLNLDDGRPRQIDANAQAPAWSPDGTRIAFLDYIADERLKLASSKTDGSDRNIVEGASGIHGPGGGLDWRCN